MASLSSALDIVAPACGQTLSVAEKAAVETSLSVVKADNGFDTVVFWGRISGIAADYLIAQGYSLPYAMVDASSSPAVSFYRQAAPPAPRLRTAARSRGAGRALTSLLFACSTDGVKWDKMDAIDDATSARCAALTKPFAGDASTVSVVTERAGPAPGPEEGEEAPAEAEDDGEPAPEGYTKVKVTEAMRLAYSVAAIDSSCATIPKGAMIMDANENVAPNRSFAGVDGGSATDPAAFAHFRPVANPKSIVKLGDAADPASDVFESLADDVPTGCWSFKLSGTGGAVVLSNLLWPGFTGYASLGSASYGYCYFGNGLKNADIAFML